MTAPQSSLPLQDSVRPVTAARPGWLYESVARRRSIAAGNASCHELLHDSFAYLASKIIPGFFALVSVPVFVRVLGIEEYGRLSLLLPVLMAPAAAGAGWLQQGILRFHPPARAQDPGAPGFYQAVRGGTAWAVLGLALLLVPVLRILHYPAVFWLIAELYCALQLIYSVRLSGLQARLLPRQVAVSEMLRAGAGFMLPLALILLTGKKSLALMLAGLACGYALPLAIGHDPRRVIAGYGRRRGQGLLLLQAGAKKILAQLWRFGWAVGAWLMLCQALPLIGRSMIERYAGYAQAGVYASLYELAVRAFSFFAFPVTLAAHPRIMRSWNLGDYAGARRTLAQAIWMQALLFIPVEAAGIAFARPLTTLISGDAAASRWLLPLLMLGGFLWQTALLAHKPLEILEHTRTMLAGMLAVIVCEFLGNYLLVPRFGMIAAVYVFVLGALVYLALVSACAQLLQDRPGCLPASPAMETSG